MTGLRMIAVTAVFSILSACSNSDLVTRNSATDPIAVQQPVANWNVADVRVTVPRNLVASEADVYYPYADLVWHGDPPGDRYLQVQELMDRGLTAGVAQMQGTQSVYIDITVRRFHSVTPKTENTVGGYHDMVFDMSVVDAETGAILVQQATHRFDVKAYGGRKALTAARAGHTKKNRIMGGLQGWIQNEFGIKPAPVETPQGYVSLR